MTDKIANGCFFEPLAQFAKQGDAMPLRIGLPCFAFAAVVIGGNRDVGDFLGGVDPAEPSDDVKFDDVLHCLSPDRVRRNVLTDMTGRAPPARQPKNGGSIHGNRRRNAGFLLARMKAVQAANFRQSRTEADTRQMSNVRYSYAKRIGGCESRIQAACDFCYCDLFATNLFRSKGIKNDSQVARFDVGRLLISGHRTDTGSR
jgi:hypothetical protein